MGKVNELPHAPAKCVAVLMKGDSKRVLAGFRAVYTLNIDKYDEVPPSTPYASNVFFIHYCILCMRLARPLSRRPVKDEVKLKNLNVVDIQYFTDD